MADGESEDFRRFLQTRRADVAKAYVVGDVEPLQGIATEHDPASFLGPGGGAVQGVQRINEVNLAGAKSFRPGGSTRLEVLHHCASDGLAFWTGYQHATVFMQGKAEPVAMKLRITEVFRREDGEWKLVHRHADRQETADAGRSTGESGSLPFKP
jgi:ketosteroid isomerase-like protein